MKSIALHGQAASATVEEAAEDMAKLRERCASQCRLHLQRRRNRSLLQASTEKVICD